ncbi:MAG: bifunctional phosphopantothenoylcysteine decarboxylase/phosphopantothenate--cysteine ligase CoaBC [Kiritimatiellia bacterium]
MSTSGNQEPPVVICGICGGIAACKAADAVSSLTKLGLDVRVIMSRAAQEFVTPLTFQALTGKPVTVDMFAAPSAERKDQIYPHLYPSANAALFVMLPATADMIARIVRGEAEDVMAASVLGLPPGCIRVFCPAMNTTMWQQPAVQKNVEMLESQGWIRIGPGSGMLACKAEGEGRMTEPDEIVRQIAAILENAKSLQGKRVLILSGPTREQIDPVRFISNPSTGKMGKALAEEALRRGAQVDFITGPVDPSALPRGNNLTVQQITSANEMLAAAKSIFAKADIILFAAAVADYAPSAAEKTKLPKEQADLHLTLKPTPDIAAALCKGKKKEQVAVGFALQDEDGENRARAKLENKNLDAIVLNKLDAVGADDAAYKFFARGLPAFEDWKLLTKRDCAKKIFDRALKKFQ